MVLGGLSLGGCLGIRLWGVFGTVVGCLCSQADVFRDDSGAQVVLHHLSLGNVFSA